MYEKLFFDFKSQLADRQLLVRAIASAVIAFLCCLPTAYIILFKYDIWWLYGVVLIVSLIIGYVIAYITIFLTVKKKLNLGRKDFWHCRRTIKKLHTIQHTDVKLLLRIIKKTKINTRPKVKEAIRHFQVLLHNKKCGGIAITSVISILLTVIGFILPVATVENSRQFLVILIMLLVIVIMIAVTCFAVNSLYKVIYYDISDYAINVRIEAALSEIWMKKLVK